MSIDANIGAQPTILDQLAAQIGVTELRVDPLGQVDGGTLVEQWYPPGAWNPRVKTFEPVVFRWRKNGKSFAYAVLPRTRRREVKIGWFTGERVDLDEIVMLNDLMSAIAGKSVRITEGHKPGVLNDPWHLRNPRHD